MLKILYKIVCFALPTAFLLVWTNQSSAYNVSGVVEFSYRDYETKTGDSRTSEQSWTQLYRAGMQSYLFDPRFLRFNAGIGYSVHSAKSSQDTNTLDYDLNAAFFPGMKYNWNVYGRKTTTTIESDSNIAGYTVQTTGYGGTLYLNLSRGLGRNGNRNRNNNDNNSGNGLTPVLPDISLSRNHSETESLSQSFPLRETLDSTMAFIRYRPLSSVYIDLNGGLEEYRNLLDHSSYDNKTANLVTTIAVAPNADLRMNGRATDRTTHNMTGFNTNEKSFFYDTMLDFKEQNKFRHYYSYNFSDQQVMGVAEYSSQNAAAGVAYRISDRLQTIGEVNYATAELVSKSTSSAPDQKSTRESEGALAGILYNKQYTPNFLGPFSLHTNYGFRYGFTKYDSPAANEPSGSGYYYTNNANVGVSSTGWTKENLALDYTYNNKRDQSPVHNMTEQQIGTLSFSSRRVSRTNLNATASYVEQKNKSERASVFLTNQFVSEQGAKQHVRIVTYNFAADHAATDLLSLNAGATRSETRNNPYTLSTLTPNNQNKTQDDLVYAGANFTYPISRNLRYRATIRDEYRRTNTTHMETYRVDMYLDYRIRMVFVNLESRWQEDMPAHAQKTQQQYYFVKVTRPF